MFWENVIHPKFESISKTKTSFSSLLSSRLYRLRLQSYFRFRRRRDSTTTTTPHHQNSSCCYCRYHYGYHSLASATSSANFHTPQSLEQPKRPPKKRKKRALKKSQTLCSWNGCKNFPWNSTALEMTSRRKRGN